MLIGISGFGRVGRRRVQCWPNAPTQLARAAYYTRTGGKANGQSVRHRKNAGHVRFTGAGGVTANYPGRMVGTVLECDDPCVWHGPNKAFFLRLATTPVQPDCFLVVARSEELGHLQVGAKGWRSEESFLISFSEWRDKQEAMLLLPCGSWVRTDLGRVVLMPYDQVPWHARLRFEVAN